ncbi:hypothetical protein [Silvanigrella aquatica]|uniref:Uncharacterized protein n=1 Tax=Silvanigrella aquatica TaxID=1915309 RepID=A0A1L4D157_9BACT|nr:hypothetical protein [Silvanigrella aquatica]APJ03942.1 hypothetical protein AXG55_08500 [Silvanigrella aquatica]
MDMHDLLIEAIEKDIPKDFLIKVISQNKKVVNESKQIIQQQQEALLMQIQASYKFAKTGILNLLPQEEEVTAEVNPKLVDVLSDHAEYKLKDLAQLFEISYKNCSKIFNEKEIPHQRRDCKGKIFLGKTVKKYFLSKEPRV